MASNWDYWDDLPPEEEKRLVEKLANWCVDRGIGTMATVALESTGNLTSLFAEFYTGLYGAHFEVLGVAQYIALFRNKSIREKVIRRIEDIEKERDQKKAKKPESSPP